MVTDKSRSELEEKIRNWLMEDGWSLRKETPQKGLWAFVADDGMGRKIVVGQNIGREDTIIIQGGITIDNFTSQKINELPESERDEFLWNLRFELLRTNLEFNGIMLPLKQIELMERIVIDALSKDCFTKRISEVKKGVLIVLWMLARKFGQQPSKQQMGFRR